MLERVTSNSHESARALGLEADGGVDEGGPLGKGDGVVVERYEGGGEGGGGESALAVVVMEVEGRVEQGKFGVPCRHMQTTFGH